MVRTGRPVTLGLCEGYTGLAGNYALSYREGFVHGRTTDCGDAWSARPRDWQEGYVDGRTAAHLIGKGHVVQCALRMVQRGRRCRCAAGDGGGDTTGR